MFSFFKKRPKTPEPTEAAPKGTYSYKLGQYSISYLKLARLNIENKIFNVNLFLKIIRLLKYI